MRGHACRTLCRSLQRRSDLWMVAEGEEAQLDSALVAFRI